MYQSYTIRLTELWSLLKPAQGLNTYNNQGKGKDKAIHEQALRDPGD